MIMAIGLAMIFVYMVLASQFESFLQPIVIMLVLPIAVPFALFTLWVTGRTLNLWSALGMLLLLGIVKKNSILQVDYANVLRARGVPLRDAIVESCRTRLRPILMTTTAIIAGLIPTSLGIGIGGTGRAAIAVTIIGGQSLCLFLTQSARAEQRHYRCLDAGGDSQLRPDVGAGRRIARYQGTDSRSLLRRHLSGRHRRLQGQRRIRCADDG
jgi:Cu/Ag efflux pump CusA